MDINTTYNGSPSLLIAGYGEEDMDVSRTYGEKWDSDTITGITSGQAYSYSIQVQTFNANKGAYVMITYYDEQGRTLSQDKSEYVTDTGSEWSTLTGTSTAPLNASYAVMSLCIDGQGKAWFADASFTASTAAPNSIAISGADTVTIPSENQYKVVVYDENGAENDTLDIRMSAQCPDGVSFDEQTGILKVSASAQAEKIIFTASDYDRVISASNSTAHEYAKASGLLNGVTYSSENDPITLEAAAVMLNNLINMNVVEYDNSGVRLGDETIMESMLNVYEGRGIVTATNETGIYGYDALSGKNVMIGDTVYNAGTTTAQSMIGRYVKFYYKNDKQSGEYVLKWIEVDNSKTKMEVIYGCDVTSASNTSITYDANTGSRKTAQISGDAEIIYNGRRSDSMTIEAVQSLTSEITLIDNDNSNAYDVVVIKDYSYYLVGSFSSDALTVNDYESQQTLDVDENHYDVFNIYKDGAAASVSDIAAGQVLAAAISEDGRIISIDILTGSVSGEITSYSSGSVVIGGTEYSISPAYAGAQLKNGRSGTFYFDKLGKVVRCEALKAQTSKYGYLISYYSNADGSSDFEAKILTAEGNITTFKVRDTISYNDSKRTAKEVYNLLGAINGCEQLITYEINSENVITRMQTADSNYIGVDEEEPDKFTLNYSGTGKYRKNNLCFNSKYLIDSTTPIFLVPYDGERDGYAVKNASYLTNSYIYNISVYDIDEFMYASAIVLKENLIEPENMRNKRPLIVTEILNGVNDDGDQAIIVEGYQQGSKVSLALANENMNDNRGNIQVRNLKAGDVIQYGTNAKGEINVVQLLYRAQTNELSIAGGTDTPNTYWEGGTAVFPDLWASCGPVVNRSSELIMVDDDGDDTRRRRFISQRTHATGARFISILEPYMDKKMIKDISFESYDRIRVDLNDGRSQVIEIAGLESGEASVRVEEYEQNKLIRKEEGKGIEQ